MYNIADLINQLAGKYKFPLPAGSLAKTSIALSVSG
jgi:hypothetical protein